jgi:hypothetical protein
VIKGDRILASTRAAFIKSEITGDIEATLDVLSRSGAQDLTLTLSCGQK